MIMGQYSLDNYELYETLYIRPDWSNTPPCNAGYGQANLCAADELMINIRDREALRQAARQSRPYALLIEPDRDGLLNTAQMMAEHAQQRHWLRHPVYARLKAPPDEEMKESLWAWHVRACNYPGLSGCDLRLRRLTCPRTLSAGGVMPLRLWLVNAGPSPLYGGHDIRLRLQSGANFYDMTLKADPALFMKMGDIVYNELTQLPVLPADDYTLMIGCFRQSGEPLYLNTTLREQEGLYALGILRIDTRPRPELYTAWDRRYPDGYYPLEDPAAPVQ